MCGSYVHGCTSWSTSELAVFTVLLVTTTHRKQVHFNWLGSNSKVQGEGGGRHHPLLQPPEDADPKVNKLNTLFKTKARQSFNFSNAWSKQPERTVEMIGQPYGCRFCCSGGRVQRLFSLRLRLYSTSVHCRWFTARENEGTYSESAPTACLEQRLLFPFT